MSINDLTFSTQAATTPMRDTEAVRLVCDPTVQLEKNPHKNTDEMPPLEKTSKFPTNIPGYQADASQGGMTLYIKAGPDQVSVGDCPFAHYVRMVLETKELEYQLLPSVQDTKPNWLIEHYDGKMPALRHRQECYVESDTIANYLDFFFPEITLTATDDEAEAAFAAVDGFFPALAQYLKHTTDGDDEDQVKQTNLKAKLQSLEDFLTAGTRTGPYLVGDGAAIRMNDCKLAPMLYIMSVTVPHFKGAGALDLSDFPKVKAYMDFMFEKDPAFLKSVYPPEVAIWGWSNARSK